MRGRGSELGRSDGQLRPPSLYAVDGFQEDRQPCSNQRGLRAEGGHPAAKGRQTSSLSRSNNAGVRELQTELPGRARAADRPSGNAVGTYLREPGGESRGVTVAPGACRVHPWQTATRRQLQPRE